MTNAMQSRDFAVGDGGYEVEWCISLPVNECGDCEPDLATYKTVYVRTKREAKRIARQVIGEDVFGSVCITPFVIETLSEEWPYGRRIEYTGDSEYVEL